MPTRDVYIIEINGEYLVRPATFIVEGRGKPKTWSVKFHNMTGRGVDITIPASHHPHPAPPGTVHDGADQVITINGTGAFEYTVTVNTGSTGVKARGHSSPIIIVDP